jgi:hypothetical protein
VKNLISFLDKTHGVAIIVANMVAFSGGLLVGFNGLNKQFGLKINKQAASLAKENGLKENELVDIFRVDKGIPLVVKRTLVDVAIYQVVSINKNGKYKMRYVGSRAYTKAEAKKWITIMNTL